MYMVMSPVTAITIMAMKPAIFPMRMEKTIKPMKDVPMAAAANVRNRPRIPMNSRGFCMPLKTG